MIDNFFGFVESLDLAALWDVAIAYIQEAVRSTKIFVPKFLSLFGILTALVEFLVRDKEKERVRDLFVWVWIGLDRVGRASLSTLVRHPQGKRVILASSFFLLVLWHLTTSFYVLFDDVVQSLAAFIDFVVVFVVVALVSITTNLPFYLFIRKILNRYIDACIQKSNPFAASFLLGALPIGLVALLSLFDELLISAANVGVGLTMGYLAMVWLVYTAVAVVYGVARITLRGIERLTLRVAETARGPVLAVAALLSAVGLALDFLSE